MQFGERRGEEGLEVFSLFLMEQNHLKIHMEE